jgi:CDP-glycerol glycerophosphotransferase (TagB/SpsB family)
MVKEFFITVYLFIFKCFFTLFKIVPLKDKMVFVATFKQNSLFLFNEARRQDIPDKIVFLCKGKRLFDSSEVDKAEILCFETFHPIDWVKSVYHLATSKRIIVDNYYAFLSAITFKPDVICLQLWHAAGAIKTFGLKDRSIDTRPKRARTRFRKVYHQFHKITVGSEAQANIFIEAFSIPPENILRAGIPRTDLFYDKKMQNRAVKKLFDHNPKLVDKKVILYAPTYRDRQLDYFEMQLDIKRMADELGNEFVLLLKLHPAIKDKLDYEKLYPNFVFDYSDYPDVNELLLITDYLITDYSSIPYEFSLLNKPMIFYPYDLEEYSKERGLWGAYEDLVPGPIAQSTGEIIQLIKENRFDMAKVQEFAKKWNQYSKGHSSKNIIDFLYGMEEAQILTSSRSERSTS